MKADERPPPQDLEAEAAVLGCMLMDADCIDEVLTRLEAESFYRPDHRMLFNAVRGLHAKGKPIDIIPNFRNDPTDLVTVCQRVRPVPVTEVTVQITPTDPRAPRIDNHIARFNLHRFNIPQLDLLITRINRSLHRTPP